MVAVAIGGAAVAGLAGSAISAGASKSAGNTAAAAQEQSAAVQQNIFNQTQANLAPYNMAGQGQLPTFSNFYRTSADQLGQAYNNAFDHIPQPMTEANLINTPGYQFNLSQGLRAVQNSNAAKGLGVSGSALQGAAKYATGLADSTYQNQFANQQQIYNDYLSQASLKGNQLATIFGQLESPVRIGEAAAAQGSTTGATSGANIGNSLAQAGNAQAAGITGSANALSGGLQSIGNSGIAYLGLQNALAGGGSTGSGFVDTTSPFLV